MLNEETSTPLIVVNMVVVMATLDIVMALYPLIPVTIVTTSTLDLSLHHHINRPVKFVANFAILLLSVGIDMKALRPLMFPKPFHHVPLKILLTLIGTPKVMPPPT